MRSTTLTLLFFCLSFTLFSQKKDPYKRFKKGEFAYVGQENEVKIIRTKRKQTENLGGGTIIQPMNSQKSCEFIVILRIYRNPMNSQKSYWGDG